MFNSHTYSERGLDSDFTLALLMSALTRRKSLRLILVSATISTDKFACYLGEGLSPIDSTSTSITTSLSPPMKIGNDNFNNNSNSDTYNRSDAEYGIAVLTPSTFSLPTNAAPVMFIPGYTYPVTEYYKSDFEGILRGHVDMTPRRVAFGVNEGNFNMDGQDPLKSRIGGLKRSGDIDFDLLVRLIIKLAVGGDINGKGGKEGKEENMFLPAEGSVLIFLPGVPEINKTIRLLEIVWQDMVKPSYAPRLKIMPL